MRLLVGGDTTRRCQAIDDDLGAEASRRGRWVEFRCDAVTLFQHHDPAVPPRIPPGRYRGRILTQGYVERAGSSRKTLAMSKAGATNDEMIRNFLAAWERRDTEFVMESFADDAVYHSIPLTPIVGKAAIERWVTKFADVPPGRLEIRHQVASGDVVMNERTDYITINGQAVVLPICGVFEIENGRIKEWREYFDLGPAKAAYDKE
ncbi:MAG TPA: limonene-1,2-epoxide hydrolase family protein [Acidimicrobiales bacterium]